MRERIGAVVGRIASGDHAGAAEQFVETAAIGLGAWAQFPPEARQIMFENAPTFLDEANDPEQFAFDLGRITAFSKPVLLTTGAHSPPLFAPVVARITAALRAAQLHAFPDAGHIPHVTHPDSYIAAIADFISTNPT